MRGSSRAVLEKAESFGMISCVLFVYKTVLALRPFLNKGWAPFLLSHDAEMGQLVLYQIYSVAFFIQNHMNKAGERCRRLEKQPNRNTPADRYDSMRVDLI